MGRSSTAPSHSSQLGDSAWRATESQPGEHDAATQAAAERPSASQPAGLDPAHEPAAAHAGAPPVAGDAGAAQPVEQAEAGARSAELPATRWPAEFWASAKSDRNDSAAPGQQEPEVDAATGLLSKEGLIRRLHAVRNGDRPVALTLVRLDGHVGTGRFADPGTRPGAAADFELSELAGRVRNLAPENAELARFDGPELAILLPHTTRDQAEQFAADLEAAWLQTSSGQRISTGVVQSNPDATTVDARALINAARHALTPAAATPTRPADAPTPRSVEELAALDDNGDTLRIGREIIRSLSIPEGSGGKRRAADAGPADQPWPDSDPTPDGATPEQANPTYTNPDYTTAEHTTAEPIDTTSAAEAATTTAGSPPAQPPTQRPPIPPAPHPPVPNLGLPHLVVPNMVLPHLVPASLAPAKVAWVLLVLPGLVSASQAPAPLTWAHPPRVHLAPPPQPGAATVPAARSLLAGGMGRARTSRPVTSRGPGRATRPGARARPANRVSGAKHRRSRSGRSPPPMSRPRPTWRG